MTDAMARMLDGAFDYAGIFPPAKLSMEHAVHEYLRHRSGKDAWIMDRFVCSAARLDELHAELAKSGNSDPISISVVGTTGGDWGDGLVADAEAMTRFIEQVGDRADIEAYEIRVTDHDRLADYLQDLKSFNQVDVFCELPWSSQMVDSLGLIVEQDWLGAKARTGGLDASAVPSCEELASFIQQCVQLELPFKLTAGLHHPIRSHRAEIGGRMHGFINVNVATVLLVAHDLSVGETASILEAEDPSEFRFDEQGLAFRDLEADLADIEDARSLLAAIGSCSIAEPLEDLKKLNWI